MKPFGGTPAQVRKLLEAGLWHDAGHGCKRCSQPVDGYMIHDFFEGGRNTTRAQHEANKQGAAERAAKSRANRKASGNETDSDPKTNRIGDEPDANSDRTRFRRSQPAKRPPNWNAMMEMVGRLKGDNTRWKEIKEQVEKAHGYRFDSDEALRKQFERWAKHSGTPR